MSVRTMTCEQTKNVERVDTVLFIHLVQRM